MPDNVNAAAYQAEKFPSSGYYQWQLPTMVDESRTVPSKVQVEDVPEIPMASSSGAESSRHPSQYSQESYSLPPSPAAPNPIFVDPQPPLRKVTVVEEAQLRVEALICRIDVHKKEKDLAQSRMNECIASLKLYKAQFALADQRMDDVRTEVAMAKNALAMARRTARSFMNADLFKDGREGDFGMAV